MQRVSYVNATRVRALARERGVTLVSMSSLMEKDKNYLSVALAGGVRLTVEELSVIAERLGTTPEYLTDQTDDPTRQDAPSALDEQLSGIEFALFGEVRGLSDTQKQTILDFARFVKEQGGKQ